MCKTGKPIRFFISRFCLALVFFICVPLYANQTNPGSATTAQSPKSVWVPYRATYVAIMNGTTVDENGIRALEYLGNQRFRFKTVAENLLFKIEEIAEFQVDGHQVIPLQYQSTRSNPFKKRKKAVGFDWENMKIHYQDRKRSGSLSLNPPLFDPLTSVLELAKQLQRGNTEIHFKEANGRKIKDRHFKVIGEELLSIPYGKLNTVKIKKVDDDKETLIWFAPKLDYLAVKVQQQEDNEKYMLELKTYKPRQPIEFNLPTPAPDIKKVPIKEPPSTPNDIK